MRIEVLGTGCVRCNTVEAVLREAVARMGIAAEVVKVSGRKAIGRYGVLLTPAVVIDGHVISSGAIPEVEEAMRWLGDAEQENSPPG